MALKFQYGADLRHQAVETALGDESPVGRQQRTPVHRAARFLNILVEVAPHGNMRAQMPQPQLIEDFLVLFKFMQKEMNIPLTIKEMGTISEDEYFAAIDKMANLALADACTTANPRVPTKEDIVKIYRKLWSF